MLQPIVQGALWSALLFASSIAQTLPVATLLPSGPSSNDQFGKAAAIHGGQAVVGSSRPSGGFAGAAFIFERQPDGSFSQKAMLVPPVGVTSSSFGTAVAITTDRVVVGSQHDSDLGASSGAAYVFERDALGTWSQTAKLLANDGATNDQFGCSVAIDGTRIVVGALAKNASFPSAGAAYIFEKQASGTWLQVAKLVQADAIPMTLFGCHVSLSGDCAAIGARGDDDKGFNSGSVSIFERDGAGLWTLANKVTAADGFSNDGFGFSVAVSGSRLLVGSHLDDDLGLGCGAAYLFERLGPNAWTQAKKIVPADGAASDRFGSSVALDGDLAIIGAVQDSLGTTSFAGSAYLFQRDLLGNWNQSAKLTAAFPVASGQYGGSVGISGERILVGSPQASNGAFIKAGLVDLWRTDGSGWSEILGAGVAGCSGAHTVALAKPPEVGIAGFGFLSSAAPASSLGVGLLTDQSLGIPVDLLGIGIPLHTDLFTSSAVLGLDVPSNAAGAGSVLFSMPNDPLLVGTHFTVQILWAWTACSLPPYNLSSTPGLTFRVLAP
ncbi:MAG: hypothetical protein JNJ88_08250 [Planctomycetes bacterium]|nr:hypothetical protein [Planctomycetota bacterium]